MEGFTNSLAIVLTWLLTQTVLWAAAIVSLSRVTARNAIGDPVSRSVEWRLGSYVVEPKTFGGFERVALGLR